MDITPRKDQYHQDIKMINHNLNSLLRNSTIRVKHSNSQYLHDDRHLRRNRNQGEAMSVKTMSKSNVCKNIYETMTQKAIEMELKNLNGILVKIYIIGVYKIADTKIKT